MSSSGVGGDASVTLTLADTQGMLSGGLDTVTLNITSQVSNLQTAVGRLQSVTVKMSFIYSVLNTCF